MKCGLTKCGIVGIFGSQDRLAIEAMVASIGHRGPDDEGTYFDKYVSLGRARLSIIDLSANGHQPMIKQAGTIAIVFNGEIYNTAKNGRCW